jgi:hypothetical protein
MYRLRPTYEQRARPIGDYPHRSVQAAAIMAMIQNNLDPAVAQHPHELVTYGGDGSVFQNWAQYRLTMKYLASMTDDQTLVLYSGHPLGLFPSSPGAPRVVVTNGMMVPNYSKPEDCRACFVRKEKCREKAERVEDYAGQANHTAAYLPLVRQIFPKEDPVGRPGHREADRLVLNPATGFQLLLNLEFPIEDVPRVQDDPRHRQHNEHCPIAGHRLSAQTIP